MNIDSGIANLKNGKTGRFSSWDRTGGNKDFLEIAPGETALVADIEGPGIITHLWCTGWQNYRDLLIKVTWDDAEEPSILTPYGDFFGQGNCYVNSFQSLWFTSSTDSNNKQHALTALNCYLPMPFKKRARIEFINEGEKKCIQYFYIDYETYDDEAQLGQDPAYLHADFRMERPFGGWGPDLYPNSPEADGITLLGREAWDNNYILTEAKGRGHYIGCFFNVVNLQATSFRGYGDQSYSWWGEGDEMFWVDGYKWPPDIHGTGSEDYFNQALGMQRNAYLRNGTAVHEFDTGGFSTSYVFHVENPVRFKDELKATIEIGHANHLGNDISSVAFFYLDKPTGVTPPPSVEIRTPIKKVRGKWHLTSKNTYTTRSVPIDDAKQLEIDQWRRKAASDFWVTRVGRLGKDSDGRFILEDRNDSAKSQLLTQLLTEVAETAADQQSPKVTFDIFGADAWVQLSQSFELTAGTLQKLEANLNKVVKITAGVLLEEEIPGSQGADCKVTVHDRITFRD